MEVQEHCYSKGDYKILVTYDKHNGQVINGILKRGGMVISTTDSADVIKKWMDVTT